MLALKRTVTVILISFGQVNLYDSLLLEFLELIHCVVLELVFLPNRFLQKGEIYTVSILRNVIVARLH